MVLAYVGLLGIGLVAAVAVALGRRGAKSGLLSTEAGAGSWEPATLSSESDYVRFGN